VPASRQALRLGANASEARAGISSFLDAMSLGREWIDEAACAVPPNDELTWIIEPSAGRIEHGATVVVLFDVCAACGVRCGAQPEGSGICCRRRGTLGEETGRRGSRGMTSGRRVIERFLEAMKGPIDWETVQELQHPDFVDDWPQSGERTIGRENFRAILDNYPGGIPADSLASRRIVGSEEEWSVGSGFGGFITPVRIVGTGDVYTWEGLARYANGTSSHVVGIIELRQGKIAKSTTYFAAPFEAADWRSQWVEKIDTSNAE